MAQVSKYPVDKDVYNEIFDTFLQTIANLKSKNEVLAFFHEFLTHTERIMFSKRLAAGLLIAEGYNYRDISSILKTSTSTIATFSMFYKYGSGYKKVIDQIKKDKEIREFLLNMGEKLASLGTFGGKGSGQWREVTKLIKDKKSKLLR